MKAMQMTVSAVLLSTSLVAFSDVTFTGGADGSSRDLSLAENWSAVPGASDVATVDVSAFGGTFTVGTDAAFAGLVFANGTLSDTVEISGDGKLTLGASGFTLGADVKLVRLQARVALSAAQTWTLGDSPLDTLAPITGTADWTIVQNGADSVVRHLAPLCYGGHVTYDGTGGGVRFLAGTNWAQKVTLSNIVSGSIKDRTGKAPFPNILALTNEVRWSQIFTGGELAIDSTGSDYVRFLICQSSAADAGSVGVPGRLIFETGDKLNCLQSGSTRGRSRVGLAQGTFDMRGGEIINDTVYQFKLTVGALTSCRGASDYNGISKSAQHVLVSGGTFKTSAIEFGEGVEGGDHSTVAQTGGTVDVTVGLYVGTSSASGHSENAIVEYLLSGGLLSVGSNGSNSGWDNHQSCGLMIAGSHIAAAASSTASVPAGLFEMSGGELRAKNITFGPEYFSGDPANFQATNNFGVFDLSGGTVPLRCSLTQSVKGTGFAVGKAWNRSATNSHYRISLRGGRIETGDTDYRMNFGAFLPPSETAFTWDTGTAKTTFDAPLAGEGTLVKEGAGELALTDATRFHGTLDVAAGKVSLAGEFAGSDTLGDCYKWCADDLKATLADGEKVTEWTDSVHGVAVVSNTYGGSTKFSFNYPTLALDDGFNSHAAVRFGDWASLMVPAADNPLVGLSTGTVVIVFRAFGSRTRFTHYGHQTGPLAMASSWSSDMQFKVFAANDLANASVEQGYGLHYLMSDAADGAWNFKYPPLLSVPGRAIAEDVHVAVATISGGDFSLYADGYYSASTHAEWNGGKTSSGKNRALASSGIYLASRITDGSTKASFPCSIAEFRLYPNKAFALDRQRELASLLYKKYRADCPAGWTGSYAGELRESSEPTPEKPSGGKALDADALLALAAPSGCAKPTRVAGAMNGKDVLRFSSGGKTALTLPAADSPTSDAEAHTVAVVFRTTDAGADDRNYFYTSPALVSSKPAKVWDDDFAVSFCAEGAVGVGYGYHETSSTWRSYLLTRKPCRLNDGLPHVAVVSMEPKSKRVTMLVDGMRSTLSNGTARKANHGTLDLTIGAACPGSGFFSGDIAAVSVYGRALTLDEMRALSESYAAEFGFRLLPTMPFAEGEVKAFGLGATNVIVRAGATLELPVSKTSAYALPAGATLSGAGTFLGSYKFGADTTLDLSGTAATVPEDVQVAGGTLRFAFGTVAEFGEFEASGTVKVEIVGLPGSDAVPRRVLLARFGSAAVADGTAWQGHGLDDNQRLRFDAATGTLWLDTKRGMMLSVR